MATQKNPSKSKASQSQKAALRRGRPRLSKDKQRSKKITLTVTMEEWRELASQAKEESISLSRIARKRIFGDRSTVFGKAVLTGVDQKKVFPNPNSGATKIQVNLEKLNAEKFPDRDYALVQRTKEAIPAFGGIYQRMVEDNIVVYVTTQTDWDALYGNFRRNPVKGKKLETVKFHENLRAVMLV